MRALVIGLGQDGRLMSEILCSKGISFRTLIRRSSNSVVLASKSELPSENIISCSGVSSEVLKEIHQQYKFTHIYNFAANSFVQDSANHFKSFIDTNSVITWEILKFLKEEPEIWFMHPLSSEMLYDTPQDEEDVARCLKPRNAYGLAKLVDLHSCSIERQCYGLKILSPIIYNHESYLRPPQFFSRKLLNYLHNVSRRENELKIYNCASVRDWGSAPEYIEIILKAAINEKVGSPLLGSGIGMSVEQFVDNALDSLNLQTDKSVKNGLLRWESSDIRIVEAHRDLADAKRISIANRDMVERFFGEAPRTYGAHLIAKLARYEI